MGKQAKIMVVLGILVLCRSAWAVEPNLVSHWKFDEGSGTTAYDSAGNNDGTIYGAEWTTGQIGDALSFDGVDDYVEIPDDDSLTPSSGLTISAWVYINELSWSDRTAIVCKYDYIGDRAYQVELGANDEPDVSTVSIHVSQTKRPHNGKVTFGTTALQPGQWYHVVATFEANHQEIYVNGIEETDDTDPGIADSIPNNNLPVYIGYNKDENTYFDGTIDEVVIYNRALSAEEVQQLYQSGFSDVVGLEITGPEQVRENYQAQYKAVVYYDDGQTKDVTDLALWWVEPNAIASIDRGLLRTERIDTTQYITIYAQYSEREFTVNAEKMVQVSSLADIEIIGPEKINGNCQEQYSLIAYYDNGDTADVTGSALWLVEPQAPATIDAGLLRTEEVNEPEEITIYAQYTSGGVALGAEMLIQVFPPHALYVPADYQTIQEAIDAADCGDEVVVADGVYTGEGNREIDFLGKPITVRSESGPENCIIDCEQRGSGFYFHNAEDANSVLDGFTITNGENGGGGIFCDGSSPTITNCAITNNVGFMGGGIFCYNSSPTISNCTVSGNSAWDGGGISCWVSNPTITNCRITGNTYGDGIYCYYSNPTITNCTIAENQGSGILVYDGSLTAVNCIITGNTAEWGAGGIFCEDSTATITNCTINGNRVNRGGGGIYCEDSTATITNCTINGNTAEWGAGICCYYGSTTITNCILTGNSAESSYESPYAYGGAIFCTGDSQKITNCTIIGNSARYYGGGIYSKYSSTTITNCILWNNTASQGNQIAVGHKESTLMVSYSDVQGGQDDIYVKPGCSLNWGEGNIDADPCFALSTDYHIMPDSPCIDAGTSDPCGGLPATDKDGVPRPLDGDGDGNAVADMGAYEYTPDSPSIAVSAVSFYFVQGWPKPDPQTLLIRNYGGRTLNWEIVEDCNWLQVAPPNGVSTSQINEVTITVDPNGLMPGFYSCTFNVQDPNASNSPVTICVTMPIGTVLPVPSLDFPTIQAAIDTADDYDIVLVADGIYTGPGNRDIDFLGKAITVRSENGPEDCVIDCQASSGDEHRGFYFHNGENANSILTGFTVINGYHWSGGGIYCGGWDEHVRQGSSPTITNCTIIGNSARYDGGGIYCGGSDNYDWRGSSPTITNCTIIGNSARYYGGGIYSGYYSSSTITNCTINGNSARYDGGGIYSGYYSSPTLTNCTISGNNAADGDGGAISCYGSSPTITNCAISDNTAEYDGGGIRCSKSSPTISNCTISGNAASEGGGISGIYEESNPKIINCIISGNSVRGYGGGIHCWEGSLTITNCILADNSAAEGGGIYSEGSRPMIINGCTIKGNIAESKWGALGGGIYIVGPCSDYYVLTIQNSNITANTAKGEWAYGGGVYTLSNNRSSEFIMKNCKITGNSAISQGGAIYFDSEGYFNITNCTISGNSAASAGGIYSELDIREPGTASITNSILWDNFPQQMIEDRHEASVTYSDVQDGWGGEGNIDSDPCFVQPGYWADANDPNIVVEPNDPNAVWIEGDYYLLPDSLCIDTGDPNYIPKPDETDVDGNPRVINGRIDMGAYESNYIQAAMQFTPQTLNCNSKGNWVKAHLTLPEGFLAEDVDVNESAAAEPMGAESEYIKVLGAGTGLVRLEITFDREAFCETITETGEVEITVIGSLTTSRYFYATDTIKIKPRR